MGIIPIFFGIYAIFSGVIRFLTYLQYKNNDVARRFLVLPVAIILFILGIMIIIHPLASILPISNIIGIFFILYEISFIIDSVLDFIPKETTDSFKTYFAMNTNCVLLADKIVGQSGIDIVKIQGIITPGAYFECFNKEFAISNFYRQLELYFKKIDGGVLMDNKLVLITGANSGTGKASSIELAKLGFHVVMMCRSKDRGEAALSDVRELSGSEKVDLMMCDLASLDSVREFCKTFKDKYRRLDVLLNNAGVILPGRHETSDGYELQFGVNHLGHFLLTNLLLDLIIKSSPSRIINVASGGHKAGKIHFDDINLTKGFNMSKAYAQSKLANVLFTFELARRLEGKGVTVNTLHPGAVGSNIAVNRDTGFGKTVLRMLKPFFQTPVEGAQTAIYLASSKDVEGVTGEYFYKKKIVKASDLSHDRDLAKRLWRRSEEMVGL